MHTNYTPLPVWSIIINTVTAVGVVIRVYISIQYKTQYTGTRETRRSPLYFQESRNVTSF